MTAEFDSDSQATICNLSGHSSCFEAHLESIRSIVDRIEVSEFSGGGPSAQVKDIVDANLSEIGWESRILLDRRLPSEISLANYTIDYRLTFTADHCAAKHQIAIELCFDNRQAIGTNLLKAELANRTFASGTKRASIAILVVLSAGIRAIGQWDSGVGTQDEYSLALRRAYEENFATTLLLLVLT